MKNLNEIEGLKVGDYKTFEKLFEQWYKPLYIYAYSIIHDAMEAEDVVQKMFCKLWDQADKIEIHTSMKSYLYRAVHNDCLNWVKSQKTKEEHHDYLGRAQATSANPTEEQLTRHELEKEIELAIENLPPRCREAFKLSRYEHLSHAKIAEKMNITTNTVETQIVKALRLLKGALKEWRS